MQASHGKIALQIAPRLSKTFCMSRFETPLGSAFSGQVSRGDDYTVVGLPHRPLTHDS